MDVLINLIMVVISQCMYVCQVTILYTSNIYNCIFHLQLNKAGASRGPSMGILDVKDRSPRAEALQAADERLPGGVDVEWGLDYKGHEENFEWAKVTIPQTQAKIHQAGHLNKCNSYCSNHTEKPCRSLFKQNESSEREVSARNPSLDLLSEAWLKCVMTEDSLRECWPRHGSCSDECKENIRPRKPSASSKCPHVATLSHNVLDNLLTKIQNKKWSGEIQENILSCTKEKK